MMSPQRVLVLDSARWSRVGPGSFWSAAAVAIAASLLIALTRFGGLVLDTPRGFFRLGLTGVWGWLGLAVAVWLLGRTVLPQTSLLHTMAGVGFAHFPLLALGFVIFVSAGMLQTLGPGLVVAVFVFVFWFPAALTAALKHAFATSYARALALLSLPYLLWLVTVGRRLLGQVQHLL